MLETPADPAVFLNRLAASRRALVQGVLLARLGVLAMLVTLPAQRGLLDHHGLAVILIWSALAAYLVTAAATPARVGALLERHPSVLWVDLAVCAALVIVGAGGRLAFYYLAAAPVVVATVLASPVMALAMAAAQSAVVAPVFLLGAEPAMEQAHSTEWAPGLVGLFVAVGLFAIVRGLFDRLQQTGVAFRERATATAAAERAAGAAQQRARVTRGLNRQLGDLLRELCTDAVALRRRRTNDSEWGVQAAAVERIARDAVAELRRATEAGSPPATLGAALAAACERVRRLGADAIDLELGGCGALALAPAEAAALSRFVQEAVTNAWKHGVPPVIVRAAAAGNRVALTVADAGAGFEPTDPAGGRGLSSLAYDARTLGGRLGFSRPITGGTAVRLEFEASDG